MTISTVKMSLNCVCFVFDGFDTAFTAVLAITFSANAKGICAQNAVKANISSLSLLKTQPNGSLVMSYLTK